MALRFIVILYLCVAAAAIRVPVDSQEESSATLRPVVVVEDTTQHQPVYYIAQEPDVDSYLVPPDPHKQEYHGDSQTPATYLLPPPPDARSFYHESPAEPGEQSDWQPVTQTYAVQEVQQSTEQDRGERLVLPIPSDQLEPPSVSAPDEYRVALLDDGGTPSNEANLFNPSPSISTPVHHPIKVLLKPVDPTLALHLIPPKYQKRIPTKIYPKKYNSAFKPVPIPIGQFVEKPFNGIPKAKPLKPFKPYLAGGGEHAPLREHNEVSANAPPSPTRKLKGHTQVPQTTAIEDPSSAGDSSEQDVAETNSRHPGNVHPARLRQAAAPAPAPGASAAPPVGKANATGERTEFRMHGMKGPHSYQFGYDTGKGKNRQFRYEERDDAGHVRGHYGYVDRGGKLRVVNYDAHPDTGFHADAPREEEP